MYCRNDWMAVTIAILMRTVLFCFFGGGKRLIILLVRVSSKLKFTTNIYYFFKRSVIGFITSDFFVAYSS